MYNEKSSKHTMTVADWSEEGVVNQLVDGLALRRLLLHRPPDEVDRRPVAHAFEPHLVVQLHITLATTFDRSLSCVILNGFSFVIIS
jgi:hypothetical protein